MKLFKQIILCMYLIVKCRTKIKLEIAKKKVNSEIENQIMTLINSTVHLSFECFHSLDLFFLEKMSKMAAKHDLKCSEYKIVD